MPDTPSEPASPSRPVTKPPRKHRGHGRHPKPEPATARIFKHGLSRGNSATDKKVNDGHEK